MVSFGIPQYIVSCFVSHSSLLITKSVDMAVALDGFPEIVRIFCTAYFHCRGAFEQFLVLAVVQQVEHNRQRIVMDTSLFRR